MAHPDMEYLGPNFYWILPMYDQLECEDGDAPIDVAEYCQDCAEELFYENSSFKHNAVQTEISKGQVLLCVRCAGVIINLGDDND